MIKAEAAKLQAKLGKGEKRQQKKEALVGICYTVDRKERTAEELTERLVDPEAARDRRQRASEQDAAPKAQHVRRLASLAQPKREVLACLKQEAARRDPGRQLAPWAYLAHVIAERRKGHPASLLPAPCPA